MSTDPNKKLPPAQNGGQNDASPAFDPANPPAALSPFAMAQYFQAVSPAAPMASIPGPAEGPLAAPVSAVASSAAPSSVATVSSVASASTAAVTGATATPSWISTISTASIKADMTAADVNGVVSAAGLTKVLTDLDATLSATSTLTASEFGDLKTIAANLNNGLSTSPDLTYDFNALVNGNAANATWTGGAASSVTLGNLATGSNATHLSELIGKWFLGTDLPSSTVNMSGYSPFTVSYSAVSNPLFGASGPSMSDVNQGYLGDCYFLSSCAEVAGQNASDITSMFTNNGNGTYGVRFYVDGVADYVTVNTELANGGTEFNKGSNIWASLAEKAFAQLQAGGLDTGNNINDGNSYGTIGSGGMPANALEALTGCTEITDFYASGSTWGAEVQNASLACISYTSGNSTATVLNTLETDLAGHDDLILSSNTNAYASNGMQTLVADHAMSIYGYDSATGMLEIRNPWGTQAGQYWDTTFQVSLSTLLSDGDDITADNAGSDATPTAPTVTNQTASQTWKLGSAVSFTLASNTFTDPQGEKLTYSAKLSSGAALPSWLSFNTTTGAFSGTVPASAAGLTIVVTATDGSNLSASETFTVSTPASAPVLAKQTATQTWKLGSAVDFTLPSTTFSDPQGEKLTYAATLSSGAALPSWLSFNTTTGVFKGTVPNTAAGLSIKVTATDTSGLQVSETFAVTTPASAPVLAKQTAAQTWKLGSAVDFALPSTTFTDPQGEKLTYAATLSSGAALPSWLSFNTTTGVFTGTVPNTAAGLSIKVTATDASGLHVSETLAVTLASPPVVANQTATQSLIEGKSGSFTLAGAFTDPQGEKLTYAATQSNGSALPSWLTFNATTETFTGTPPAGASGLTLKVTATDTSGLSASETFSLATAAPAAPKISAQTANQTWAEGKAVSLALPSTTFTDPNGEALTYSASEANGSALPTWLKFNAATKTFSGTAPTAASTFSIAVKATDAGGASATETFSVSIAAAAASLAQASSSIVSSGAVTASVASLASAAAHTLACPAA